MLGILSALGAASSWTYACCLWRQQTRYFSAVHINLIKNIIAFCIFSPVILTFDFNSNLNEICILLVSGIIGITIGDSFYIISLKRIGTRRTLAVEALSPLISTVLGSFLLNEAPPLNLWCGAFIVSISLIGIACQDSILDEAYDSFRIKKDGFIFAFASVLCAVIAAILSRLVLVNSDLSPFQTTEIRLFGGFVALLPCVKSSFFREINNLPLRDKSKILYATFFGTNLGILLQQNVFKTLPIGLGWTLLSTSPIFSLFFAKVEGEKLKWETVAFTVTIVFGVAISFIL